MSDNILSAVLTFSLLAAGTAAVGSELMTPRHAAKTATVATLPTVTVVGKRVAAADVVTLPTVVVTGSREIATLPTVVVTGHRDVVTAAAIDETGRDSRVQ
jgi:hypothetical protein